MYFGSFGQYIIYIYLFDECFKGSLVVLFTLENNQKENLKYTSPFIGSLEVFFKFIYACTSLTNVSEVFW